MKTLAILLVTLFISSSTFSQLTADKIRAIDSIFVSWNQPNHPGGSVGIMQNGKLVYNKAFGLASLEYMVPNTPGTRFNIASISKQFTGMAIVKLHLEGKLSIDADIREYLPELPDFGHKITCRHMLHHTSGLRSLHMMLSLAGWRGDDSRNNDDLLRYVIKQKDLNFKPGDEYMYCNTGYILMAIIVERLTGKVFADYMNSEIFQPLGLYDTYVEDQYNRVVTNNATSYYRSNEGFARAVEYWGYTGSGNIHATTADLLKWYRYYYDSPEGWKDAFEMMQTTDPFNDGSHNKYAFGINVDEFLGEKRISHGGSIGGFRASSVTFPDKEIEIIVLTNFSAANPGGRLNQAVSILFDKALPERPPRQDPPEKPPYKVSEAELKKISGDYWSPELETVYRFYVRDGKLYGFHNRHGEFELEATEKNIFIPSRNLRKIEIIKDKKGNVIGMYLTNSRVRNLKLNRIKTRL